MHRLEALEVGLTHHVREIGEHGPAAADARVVVAGLPASPSQGDLGIRGHGVQDRHCRQILVLKREVVVGHLGADRPGVGLTGVGLEFREKRDIERWTTGCTLENRGELADIVEKSPGQGVVTTTGRPVGGLRGADISGSIKPHHEMNRTARGVGLRNSVTRPVPHESEVAG